jgi:NitT/TauT family transport system substrate-binding protein
MQESWGTLLVDEASLWPGGSFATTELAVTERFLAAHPDVVRSLITADADAVAFIGDHPAEAKTAVNDQLLQLTQKKLAVPVLDAAWRRLTFTVDPLTATFRTEAVNAERLGLLAGGTSLQNIADLRQLNDVLRQRGQSAISANGLGLS